ncbi:MAG TPA: hypothetical protein VGS03_00500 [Candidatus Polarisedimenticolia bacterium]|jgi:hypothetical protein|nr:hypothetical protein [Candidatus Polarisedimenticolia bacterium]
MAGSDRRQGILAWQAIERLARDILRGRPGAHLLEGRLPVLDVHVPLALQGHPGDAETFAASLAEEIERQIDDAIEEQAAFQPGHSWCHRCEAAACEHSRPPSSRHVFLGYAPAGAPRWMEFAQYAMEARLPAFERLYAEPPAFLTVQMDRSDLYGPLLPAFRSAGRDLLGQVIAGFFPVPSRAGEGRGVVALTFQAAVRVTPEGRRRIGLNILGTSPAGGDLSLLWERQDDLPWRRAVRWAQAALMTAARDARAPRRESRAPERGPAQGPLNDPALERRVLGILQGLARRLEQDRRGSGRRTAHAGERHEQGTRPTRKAIDDIREARSDAFLRDERSGAVVVLGDRGRTHFFTPEGRLMSSVRYSREAIDRKRRAGLWRDLAAPEARRTRETLLRAGASGEDGDDVEAPPADAGGA